MKVEYLICEGDMIYSELVRRACQIMYDAHKEDVDNGGYPYVFHPFYLATQMDTEQEICVAMLHDVVEDHGDKYSFEYLQEQGFTEEIIDAIKLLTHKKGVDYMDYIKLLSVNPIARKVKMADLKHNMDSSRTNGIKSKKYDLYVKALNYLENL